VIGPLHFGAHNDKLSCRADPGGPFRSYTVNMAIDLAPRGQLQRHVGRSKFDSRIYTGYYWLLQISSQLAGEDRSFTILLSCAPIAVPASKDKHKTIRKWFKASSQRWPQRSSYWYRSSPDTARNFNVSCNRSGLFLLVICNFWALILLFLNPSSARNLGFGIGPPSLWCAQR